MKHGAIVSDDIGWLRENGEIVDLFAGGGGASVGTEQALGRPVTLALNHDPLAVALHGVNHPRTRHLCQDIWQADPIEATRGRPVFWLHASPSCTQHSRSRRALPAEKQLREMGWRVIDWAEKTRPVVITMENVGEWRDWGPLGADGFPDKSRTGETWAKFVQAFRDLGYDIEWRMLNAADYGAPTTRERLFVVARRDGLPIRWPEPTHGAGRARPWKSAGDYVDWGQDAPSIFDRRKELAPATIDRIMKGLDRFVVNHPDPYVAPIGTRVSNIDRSRQVAAFLTQNNTGMIGHDLRRPLSTITSKACNQSLVVAFLDKLRNNARGVGLDGPTHTICAQGDHFAEVRVAAYGVGYYSQGGGQLHDMADPIGTITTKDRFAVVMIHGTPYVITDIGYRFLTPTELWRMQGFDLRGFGGHYQIDLIANGKPLAATHQKRMVGNSVCPPVQRAVVAANVADIDDMYRQRLAA